jgi:hypothetical protein
MSTGDVEMTRAHSPSERRLPAARMGQYTAVGAARTLITAGRTNGITPSRHNSAATVATTCGYSSWAGRAALLGGCRPAVMTNSSGHLSCIPGYLSTFTTRPPDLPTRTGTLDPTVVRQSGARSGVRQRAGLAAAARTPGVPRPEDDRQRVSAAARDSKSGPRMKRSEPGAAVRRGQNSASWPATGARRDAAVRAVLDGLAPASGPLGHPGGDHVTGDGQQPGGSMRQPSGVRSMWLV